MTEASRVHIVDDDMSLRTALIRLLNAASIPAVGYATAGDFLLEPPGRRRGCLLLDVRLRSGPSGPALHDALNMQGIELPIIFMTGFVDMPTCVTAIQAGAVDFLQKPIRLEILLDAVRRGFAIDRDRQAARTARERLVLLFGLLSPRERTVFERVVAGKLNKQIADELGVSERTVKAQRAHLMEKLEVTSSAELGRLAERMTLLERSRPADA